MPAEDDAAADTLTVPADDTIAEDVCTQPSDIAEPSAEYEAAEDNTVEDVDEAMSDDGQTQESDSQPDATSVPDTSSTVEAEATGQPDDTESSSAPLLDTGEADAPSNKSLEPDHATQTQCKVMSVVNKVLCCFIVEMTSKTRCS